MPQSTLALGLLVTLVLLGSALALPGVGMLVFSNIVERRMRGVLNSTSPSSLPVSLRDLP
jgi:hypothetical protein